MCFNNEINKKMFKNLIDCVKLIRLMTITLSYLYLQCNHREICYLKFK